MPPARKSSRLIYTSVVWNQLRGQSKTMRIVGPKVAAQLPTMFVIMWRRRAALAITLPSEVPTQHPYKIHFPSSGES